MKDNEGAKGAIQEKGDEGEDVYCLVSSIWGDCQYLETIDFGQFEAKPLNPNCVELEPCNNGKANGNGEASANGGDSQSLEEMMALDAVYCGDHKADVGDHNSDGVDQPLVISIGDYNPDNDKAIKINVTPVFVTNEVFSSRYSLVDWCQSQGRGIRTIVVITKTIYNANANLRTHEMEGRSAMQQLMKVLVEKHYVYWHRKDETTEEVLDLFWAHPESILLAKCFLSVVLVDCTYKTNRYKMPLFAMVGVTSTARTFSIAHCFLHREMEDNYKWALSKLKLLFTANNISSVFVTNIECAVIKAIHIIFPEAHHMLCTFHISRNVEQHCKSYFKSGTVWRKFIQDWSNLTQATSQTEFFEGWERFKKDWEQFPKCVDYLTCTWFQHRGLFVLAWTNHIKHRGNNTTNRAEGSHFKLKKYLESSQGSFSTVFAAIDNMLCLQLTEIKAVFEKSLGSVKGNHHGMLFRHIKGNISHFALDLIKNEQDKSINIGIDPSARDHVLRTIYGLPCAHELLQYGRENQPIPFKVVDQHWGQLTILPKTSILKDVDEAPELILFKKLFDQSTDDEKKVLLGKLKELATPMTTSLKEPKHVVPKGRPRGSKKSLSQKEIKERKHEWSTKRDPSGFEYAKFQEEQQLASDIPDKLSQVSKAKKMKYVFESLKKDFKYYLHYIPEFMHPFIVDIEDVDDDVNCGYRCVARHLQIFNSDGWLSVRKTLIEDLERFKEKYDEVWGLWFYIDCKKLLECFKSPCGPKFWMVMPDMGYLIALAFNCVVVFLSKQQCLTFLPHSTPLPEGDVHRVVPIAFICGCHFVKVQLNDGAPLPPVASKWRVLGSNEASTWMDHYVDKIDRFLEIAPRHNLTTIDFPIIVK